MTKRVTVAHCIARIEALEDRLDRASLYVGDLNLRIRELEAKPARGQTHNTKRVAGEGLKAALARTAKRDASRASH